MIEKEKEIKKQQEEEWIKEREEKETKIIDYSDLKKQSGRKIHNKQIAYTPEEKKEEEPVIVIVPENEEKKEEKPEEIIEEKQEEKKLPYEDSQCMYGSSFAGSQCNLSQRP